MKNFIFFLLLSGVIMSQGAKLLEHWQIVLRSNQIDLAVQRVNEAKAAFEQANSDNENALATFNQGSSEERAEILLDAGLLSDKNAMCMVDVGALDERPHAHTVAEMDLVAKQARTAEGGMTLAMR